MRELGVPEDVRMARAGHSTPAMSRDYGQARTGIDRAAADAAREGVGGMSFGVTALSWYRVRESSRMAMTNRGFSAAAGAAVTSIGHSLGVQIAYGVVLCHRRRRGSSCPAMTAGHCRRRIRLDDG
jgi:hypothetical protein